MYTFLLVIHVIVSLFLIFIILIQSGKGEGLADVFGGGSSQTTIFGSRTSTFLTKATTVCAILFMITCVSLAFLSRKRGASVVQRELIKEQTADKFKDMAKEEKPAASAPVQPAAENTAPASATEEKAPAPAAQ